MKIKEGFMLREVAGNFVVVAVGKASESFRGVITLNHTGAFLWRLLKNEITEEELVNKLLDEYDVSNDIAVKDVKGFVDKIKGANLFE